MSDVRAAAELARWAARPLVSGVVGTAAMTLTTWLERRLRGLGDEPDRFVDFDASPHVAQAVGTVLHHSPSTDTQREVFFLLAHWGYGPAVALTHGMLRTRLARVPAAGVFYVGCQAMAMTLFPTLGGTRPPWRWCRDVILSSLVQHAVYVVAVAVTARQLERQPSDRRVAAAVAEPPPS